MTRERVRLIKQKAQLGETPRKLVLRQGLFGALRLTPWRAGPAIRAVVAARQRSFACVAGSVERGFSPRARLIKQKAQQGETPRELVLRQGLFGAGRLTLRAAFALLRRSCACFAGSGRTRVLTESSPDKQKGPCFRRGLFVYWRRVRDSNPGNCCQFNGFRIRPVRPLRQLSSGAHLNRSGPAGGSVESGLAEVRADRRPSVEQLLRRLRSRRQDPGGSGPCPFFCRFPCPTGGSRLD